MIVVETNEVIKAVINELSIKLLIDINKDNFGIEQQKVFFLSKELESLFGVDLGNRMVLMRSDTEASVASVIMMAISNIIEDVKNMLDYAANVFMNRLPYVTMPY